jgi:hypothetical protein
MKRGSSDRQGVPAVKTLSPSPPSRLEKESSVCCLKDVLKWKRLGLDITLL